MNGIGSIEILTGIVTAGVTVGLVKMILGAYGKRIQNLETFKAAVIMPNVGQNMCDQKHDHILQGMKFLHDTNKQQAGKWEKDHDILVTVAKTLENVEKKIDALNNKEKA